MVTPITNNFDTPGVFEQEGTPERARPSLSDSIGALIGWTPRGKVNTPLTFRSPLSFRQQLGGLTTKGLVPVCVDAMFENGAEEIVVVRVAPSDAVEAQVEIDSVPGPTKWTFIADGPGVFGNNFRALIRGNRDFLDTSASPPAYTKFDVFILEPNENDPDVFNIIDQVKAVQFTDTEASDYFPTKLQDVRFTFRHVRVVTGAGGLPSAMTSQEITDEVLGTTQTLSGTLNDPYVLEGSVRIVASETQVNDEAQTPDQTPDNAITNFTFTLPQAPILDGSLRIFFAKFPTISNEVLTVGGVVDGANTSFTVAAGALSAPVHRENTVFRIKYANTTSASGPNLLHTDGGGGTAHDLSTTPIAAALPIHPGTISMTIDIGAGPVAQLDDGNGNFPVTPELPAGGTIDYDTGAMTGVTAPLLASSTIDESHNQSSIITKAASSDNLEQGILLTGAVASGTIDAVDSVANPTQSGAMAFVTSSPPLAASTFYIDFVQLGIVNSDVDGVLTGDVGAGTNLGETDTGDVDVTFDQPALTGETIDADYQTGQIVTDDGLGNLIGDVDAAGVNTIDYENGTYSFTLADPPLGGTDVLANYANVPFEALYEFSGGDDGTGVTRSDISAPSLEASEAGIFAFDKFEQPYALAVPDFEGVQIVQNDLINFANGDIRVNRMFLALSTFNGATPQEAAQYFNVTLAANQRNVATYYRNVLYRNNDDVQETLPSSVFAIARYAATAERVNVGKNPTGIIDGALTSRFVVGLENNDLSLAERKLLTSSRVNVLRFDLETGDFPVIWDGITTSTNPRWNTINKRLLHMFLMFRIRLILNRFVHDNNGPGLWLRIEETVTGFMDSLFRDNYFGVDTPEQAYYVICSKENNNQQTIDNGIIRIEVGFTAGEPGRFIDFTLTQPVGVQTV